MKRWISIALTAVLVASMSAGCGMPTTGGEESVQSSSSQAAVESSTESSPAGDSEAEYTLRITDWSDSVLDIREEFHNQYMENNPTIKIEYTMLTVDQFKNTILTMIKSGDGPDLFPVPSGMTLPTVVKEGWYQSMSPYVTDEFIASLDPNSLIEGVTMLDGELYTVADREALSSALIFYNQNVLDAAGVTEIPKSYDEFIAVCKQVTEAGNGAYYGLIEGGKQANRLDFLVRGFAGMAGAKLAPPTRILTVDGKAPFNTPELAGVYELFGTLTKDGSIHPDTINISAPEAREMFAQGQAAFLMQGMWCIAPWQKNYPDLKFGVMAPPSPDGTQVGGVQREEWGAWMGVYKQSANPAAATNYLMAMFSEDYDFMAKAVASGERVSIVPAINEKAEMNEVTRQYIDVAKQAVRTTPSATIRDDKAYDFYNEVKEVQPDLAAIMQGVISGSVTDYEKELAAYADASTAEWQRACEAAGVDYSVFDFSNWDAGKDYTEAQYAELK